MKRLKILSQVIELVFVLFLVFVPVHTVLGAPSVVTSVDTLTERICSTEFPFNHQDNLITEAGSTRYVTLQNSAGEDSLTVCYKYFSNTPDTIRLSACANLFPLEYEEMIFSGSTEQTLTFGEDSNGCPLLHHFIVTAYPVEDTIDLHLCDVDIPYSYHGISIEQEGSYTFQDTSTMGCDSNTTVNIYIHPSYTIRDTLSLTVCSNHLPYVIGNSSLSEAGEYDVVVPSIYGCDSALVHLTLTINQVLYDTLIYDICSDDFPLIVRDSLTYSTAGEYHLLSANENGCEDVTTLIIRERPTYDDTLYVNWCTADGQYLFADSNFTASTVYTHTGVSIWGCDSITTLVLNIGSSYNDTVSQTLSLCAYELPYNFAGTMITEAGNYEIDQYTQLGCDSVHYYLDVTVSDYPADTLELAICENNYPFTFKGTEIVGAGIYDIHVNDTDSDCDSVFHLIVTTLPVYYDTIEVTVCANEPYEFYETTLTEPGTYSQTLTTVSGCDSVITLHLAHYPVYQDDTIALQLYADQLPYVHGDTAITTEGTHSFILPSEQGCDSLITIQISLIPAVYNLDTLYEAICHSQLPYTTAFGEVVDQEGVHRFITYSTESGCDSIFYYRLTVYNPTPTISGGTYLCEGNTAVLTASTGFSSYLWSTGEVTETISIQNAGTYRVTVTEEHGCQGSVEQEVTTAAFPDVIFEELQYICANQTHVLHLSGADHYVWENGSTEDSLAVMPNATRNYYFTAYSAENCARTGYITVVVHNLPTITLAGADTICMGTVTPLTAAGGESYLWSTGDTGESTYIAEGGFYTVTATDANGCSSWATKYVYAHALPTLTIIGQTEICQNQSTNLTVSGAVSYVWSTGDTENRITTSYANTYTVTGTDVHGCTNTADAQVVIKNINAQLIGNRSFCQGSYTTLSIVGNDNYTYQWNDGSTSDSINIYTAGTYYVSVTNALGCSSSISASVSELALPTPSITGSTSICQGRSTVLRATGGTTYSWSTGSTDAYISVSETGTYYVTVTNQSGCSATTSETVIVNALPSISISARTSICQGESVTMYVQSPTGVQYVWPMTGQQSQLITVSPTTTTTYMVNVTDDNGCTNIDSTTITVQSLPNVYLSGPTSLCQGETATLTALGGSQYVWNNGLTTNSIQVTQGGTYVVTAYNNYNCSASSSITITTLNIPNYSLTPDTTICQGGSALLQATAVSGYTYAWSTGSLQSSITIQNAGQYSVTVTNESGCSLARSTNVTLNEVPTVSIAGNTLFCEGSSTTLTANVPTGCTYEWSTGTTNTPLMVATAGTYTVTAYNAAGCSSTASANVTMNSIPTPIINGVTTICRGESTILTASGGTSYLWSNGTTGPTLAISPTENTAYIVTVTNQQGCTASTSVTVTVNTLPTLVINGNPQFCEGSSTTLTATGATSYTWSTGATTSSVTLNTAGLYYVTARNSMNCQRTDSVQIVELSSPVIGISGDNMLCESTSGTLTATGGSTYVWSTGENTNNILISPTVTTTYTVTGYDAVGCSSTVSKVVNVEATPDVHITGTTTICSGEQSTLTATGGSTYLWSTGSTSGQIIAGAAGLYSVTATSVNGCTGSIVAEITVNPIPVVSLSGPTTLCENNSGILTASGGDSYLWSTGSTNSSIAISTGGTYSVTAYNQYGCVSNASQTVTTLSAPNIYIDGMTSLCLGSSSTLSASGTAATYLWSNGDTGASITIQPTESTTYSVTATGENGCTRTINVDVIVNPIYSMNISDEICQGTTYNQYGFSIPAQQEVGEFTYYNNLQSVNGCDSLITLTLTVKPTPVVPETIDGNSQITTLGSYMYRVEDAQYVDNYQWRVSNTHWELSSSTTNTIYLNITQNGNGILTAQAINDCGTAEVSINIYCNVGVEEYTNDTGILLYPVPTQNILNIDMHDAAAQVESIQLLDLLGRCLQSITVTDKRIQVDCSPYATGQYFVRFLGEKDQVIDTRKIIIRK